jgi:hypothetical protein
LTNIIKAPLKSTINKDAKKGKKESKSDVFALTRPLICICNDQYAPALRELRKIADIFVFQAPSEQRLIQRIKTICVQEGLHVSNTTFVNELCQATGECCVFVFVFLFVFVFVFVFYIVLSVILESVFIFSAFS